jgi:membrane fusion protein (multidrug efflux system)
MLTLPARVEADCVATVSAEFGGTLARWVVAEGATVQKGQVVAELDLKVISASREELEASLRSATKNVNLTRIGKESATVGLANSRKNAKLQELGLEAAHSELKLARIDYSRIRNLVDKKVMNPSQLDTAKNALTQAELAAARAEEVLASARLGVRDAQVQVKQAAANLDVAAGRIGELEAAIASLDIQAGKTGLKAPITGRIEEHLVEAGEVVEKGVPLAHVYDLKHVRATVNVPDRYVASLDPDNLAAQAFVQMNMPGAQSRLRARLIIPGLPKLTGGSGGNLAFDAEIARIAQASDPASNTYKVELRLPNPGGVLRHGFIARGQIEYLYYPQAIVIPLKAVQVTDEGPRVLVATKTEGAERVEVHDIEAISIRGDKLLIGSGLADGDRLIVAGWKGLVSGEPVNVLVDNGRFTTGENEAQPLVKKD